MNTYREEPSAAEFIAAVANVGLNGGHIAIPPILAPRADGAGANEATPAEGGFLLPEQTAAGYWDHMLSQGALLAGVTQIPITRGNSITIPALDETSRADGQRAGGVTARWLNEGGGAVPTMAKFRAMGLSARKLQVFGIVTDEMLGDIPALATILESIFTREAVFMIEDAVVNGDGLSRPLGILNSPATITATPPSGASASGIRPSDLLEMFRRLWPPSLRNAVWLLDPTAWNQLVGTSFSDATPTICFDDNGEPRILGRLCHVVEYAQPVGTRGDVILVDPTQYLIASRGSNFVLSSQMLFLATESAFRLTFRLDGQPGFRAPLVPRGSSVPTSPFVCLESR